MKCFLCGVAVELEIVRPTNPSDWEFRYQANIVRYWEGDWVHWCRLKPRVQSDWNPVEIPDEEPPVVLEEIHGVDPDLRGKYAGEL